MKKNLQLLVAGLTTFIFGNIGHAQIVYSNNFTLGSANNITNTAPTVANNYAGGTNSAVWLDALGTNDTGFLQANGLDTSTSAGTSFVLPFTPQTNFIYLLTAQVNFIGNPGNWVGFGFAQLYTNNLSSGLARFADTVGGYDWTILTESTGNVQYFAGAKTATTLYSVNNAFPANPGLVNVQILLNTKSNLWAIDAYINGVQTGTNYIYPAASNPSNSIRAVGFTQTALAAPTNVQFLNFALATTLAPFITTQPIAATTLGANSGYTNAVTVTADTNGGALSYQWYANNLPLANGVNNVLVANSNVLIIKPVTSANQFSNYYVIVTNNYGSFTSMLASLTVLTNPVITAPGTASNSIILFNGSGGIVGSSPSFSVTAIGAPTLTYQWYTNSIAVTGATNISLAFTNLQAGSPTTFACTVSNSFGTATTTWYVSYEAAPTAAYPQAVLGDMPLALWRLNEADDGNGNIGEIAHDYQSGNNGFYTNVSLGNTGYDSLETSETAMYVTSVTQPSGVFQIGDVDFALMMSNGVNAEFTAEGWANCISGNGASGGAPVISQGYFGSSSFFLGVDTNSSTKHYQFYVKNAAGTYYSADDSTVQANDVNWHYLVGVCDEVHSNISLYIDGRLSATTPIPANSGSFESGLPVAIGAGIRAGSTTYNVPFTGDIADVALYSHALTVGQIINHYSAAGNTVPVSLVAPIPPANLGYVSGLTLTIPATIAGTGPLNYYWTNVTSGGAALASGSTNVSGSINATLTIPSAPASLSGQQLELVVINPVNTTNLFVSLFSPAAPVALSYTNPILYSNLFDGGTYSVAGLALTAANVLVGGTNTTWVDELGTNDPTGGLGGNGIPNTLLADSFVVPFTPHAGYIYTLNAALTFYGNPGNWVGAGFAQNVETNGTDGRFNGAANGYNWMILTESSGNLQYFGGVSTGATITNKSPFFTAGATTHNLQIVLNTVSNQWKAYGFVDGLVAGTNTYISNPPIGAVGLVQNTLTAGVNTNIQWTSFSLTQVAPGGVPPYLLNPLPNTNSITLTNSTVSLQATAFGSGPLGYFWINNSAVIASGSTNATAPLPANLTVPSSSLAAGILQLVVTNAYGTNITSIALISPVNPNRGTILYTVTGSQLTLSWPTNLGWTLQAETNVPGVGITTNWVNVPNSTLTNVVTVSVSPTNGSVFYRLMR